jgi:hypothetical protein
MPLLMWSVGLSVGESYRNIPRISIAGKLPLIVLLVLAATIAYGVYIGQEKYGRLILFFKNYDTGQDFNYLTLADLTALWGLMTMSTYNYVLPLQMIAYLTTSVCLLFAYSRASFYLFLIWGAFALWCGQRSIHLFLRNLMLFLLCCCILGAVVLNRDVQAFSEYAIYRMIGVIIAPNSDLSFQGRLTLLREGLHVLRENLLLGEYMTEWWQTGEPGGYIHNWLSFFASYGVGPFAVFIILALSLFKKSLVLYRAQMQLAPITLLGFALLCIVVARAYNWPFIWFCMGFTAGYEMRGLQD